MGPTRKRLAGRLEPHRRSQERTDSLPMEPHLGLVSHGGLEGSEALGQVGTTRSAQVGVNQEGGPDPDQESDHDDQESQARTQRVLHCLARLCGCQFPQRLGVGPGLRASGAL